MKTNEPKANEISMKQWVAQEMEKHKVHEKTIYCWIGKGKYPDLKRRKINKRVIYVTI